MIRGTYKNGIRVQKEFKTLNTEVEAKSVGYYLAFLKFQMPISSS